MSNAIGQAINSAVQAVKKPLAAPQGETRTAKPAGKKPIKDTSFISPKLERLNCATQGVHGKVKVDREGNVTLTDKSGRSYQITDPKELVGQLRRAVDAVPPGTPVTARVTGDLTLAHVTLDRKGNKQFVPDRISASGVEITSKPPRLREPKLLERLYNAVVPAGLK